jgi:hypothetical protein
MHLSPLYPGAHKQFPVFISQVVPLQCVAQLCAHVFPFLPKMQPTII